MTSRILVANVLPGLALMGWAGVAQAQAAEGCLNDELPPVDQRAACDAEIAAETDPVAKATRLVARAGTFRREANRDGIDDALADLAEAEQLAPDAEPALRAQLLIERAEAQLASGEREAALAALAEAEPLAPDNPNPAMLRGLIMSDQGDIEGSMAELARAREIDPDDGRALFESMWVLKHAGDPETCAELGERAVTVSPSDASTWSIHGLCLALVQRGDEAMESFAEAERLAPEDPDVLGDKSEALVALDRPDEALAAARRAIELEPTWAGPRIALVNTLIAAGKPEEAVAVYEEARAAGTEDLRDQANNLGWALYLAGESELAVPIMEEWRKEFPEAEGDPFHHYALDTAAHVMAAAGRQDEAVEFFLESAEVGGPVWRGEYEKQLVALGHAVGEGDAGFEAALRACAATGEACKLFPE